MIERRPFGRTGHLSSVTLFGAAALARASQADADRALEVLLRHGVNHIDTAARYGDSELRIGPWMARHRKDFFLATKTGSRTAKEGREDIHRSLERAMDVLTALLRGARAGLRRQEEVLPVTRHPGADAELGIAVARRRVDVIHAVAQEHLEGTIRIGLTRAREGGGAEERDAAEMTGSTEWTPLDHARTSRSSPEAARAVERRAASGSISRGLSAGTAAPYLGAGVYFPVSCGVVPSSFFSCRSRRVSRPQVRLRSCRTLKRSRPSFSVSISIRSPFWKPLRPRWLVPVAMMSPGSSVWIEVTHSMHRGILCAMSLVL